MAYVDDFLVLSKDEMLKRKFLEFIPKYVKVKVIGRPETFLGIKFSYKRGEIRLNQEEYIEFLLRKFHMETSSAVKKPMEPGVKVLRNTGNETMRLMVAIAVCEGYELTQLDVVAAFQNPPISHDVYVKIPEGIEHVPGTVWKLKKSLYGLITAARSWYNELNNILTEFKLGRI